MEQQQAPTHGMTEKAQMHALIGAMCVDPVFRNKLFDTTPREARLATLQGYATDHGVGTFSNQFLDEVLELLERECAPIVKAAMEQFEGQACPCWPCRKWPVL